MASATVSVCCAGISNISITQEASFGWERGLNTPKLGSVHLKKGLTLESSSSRFQKESSFSRHGSSALSSSLITASHRCTAITYIDDEPEETEEEIDAAYRALYGEANSTSSPQSASNYLFGEEGEDVDVADGGRFRRRRDDEDGDEDNVRGPRDGFEEQVIQVRRVTKVVKGGKQLSFRAVVVVGNKKDKVGVGVGKAKEVIYAVAKAVQDAKRHLIKVPLTKYLTFPHRVEGRFGAAKVMLRPAAVGTGIIAGGAVRVVLELAGVENALGKQLGSENPLNNARAVIDGLGQMKQFRDVAKERGIPMEELWK